MFCLLLNTLVTKSTCDLNGECQYVEVEFLILLLINRLTICAMVSIFLLGFELNILPYRRLHLALVYYPSFNLATFTGMSTLSQIIAIIYDINVIERRNMSFDDCGIVKLLLTGE